MKREEVEREKWEAMTTEERTRRTVGGRPAARQNGYCTTPPSERGEEKKAAFPVVQERRPFLVLYLRYSAVGTTVLAGTYGTVGTAVDSHAGILLLGLRGLCNNSLLSRV